MTKWKKIAAVASACSLASLATACGVAGNGDKAGTNPGRDSQASISVTDVMGRTVTFDKQPERIILGEGRSVFATSILDREQPTRNVVAMGSDLQSGAPSFRDRLLQTHPEVRDIPEIGSLAKNDVNVETLLAYQPDVITMTADHYAGARDTGLLDKLDQAGLKYVVTDFRQHPMTNTTTSMTVFGKIMGKQAAADAFNTEWTESVTRVKERVAKANKKETFVWRAGGYFDCCGSVKDGNIGEFVNAAGGQNLGDSILDTEFGSVTPEKLIAEQPEHILVTGGSWAPKGEQKVSHVTLGYTSEPAKAQQTLRDLTQVAGMDKVSALSNGHSAAIWHQFYDSPMNFMAVEFIARWLHPELFVDVDTEKHWEDVHKKYFPFDASGVFFVTNPANPADLANPQ
ncbi:ABC transporter substrate-binding protein [Corynebacterium epidermidicanis]|uniref:ABC-type Fe3+-hydroxamate transport system, periplasmic component n=1 Tax=Corynebacterium epidermidicanis TaxID=1050174 RepID=A0A0G3GTQ2_9CORY|nr:ABC transporter substrate-binding protein [Corynebacterium epidermidicanis]AKK03930.1 ABC-type Fe3+-hydroxamate transport system, periplasmic component [Corynebacterium epidermidicanis]